MIGSKLHSVFPIPIESQGLERRLGFPSLTPDDKKNSQESIKSQEWVTLELQYPHKDKHTLAKSLGKASAGGHLE